MIVLIWNATPKACARAKPFPSEKEAFDHIMESSLKDAPDTVVKYDEYHVFESVEGMPGKQFLFQHWN